MTSMKPTTETILGMYPGPTIEVNEGDQLVVNVFNEVPDPM